MQILVTLQHASQLLPPRDKLNQFCSFYAREYMLPKYFHGQGIGHKILSDIKLFVGYRILSRVGQSRTRQAVQSCCEN